MLTHHRPDRTVPKARNASPIPIQTRQRSRAPKTSATHIREPAAATAAQSTPTAGDILRDRTTAPILQPTVPARPPSVPRELPPSHRYIPILLTNDALSAHGQACSRRACAVSAHGRRSWRTLRTRNVCRARRCGACSASFAKVQMCALYSATLCVLSLHGTSTGVHGYTALYVQFTLTSYLYPTLFFFFFFLFPHQPLPLLSFKIQPTWKRGKAGMV